MQWTTEKPKEAGYYWIYTTPVFGNKPSIYIVSVFLADGKIYFETLADGFDYDVKITPENTTHWMGPVIEPDSPDCAKVLPPKNQVVTFRGKRIEDMPRDELITALDWAACEIQRIMQEKQHERDFIFDVFVKP